MQKLSYPDRSSGTPSATDFDSFTYDAASNVVSKMLRGLPQTFTYDALGNMLSKSSPSTKYVYDNMHRVLSAYPGTGLGPDVRIAYDALGRITNQTTGGRTLSFRYDASGNRTRTMWPDATYVTYGYNSVNEMTSISDASTANVITFAYDDLGHRKALTRLGSVTTGYAYDAASRLQSLTQPDVQFGYARNPAGQITTRTTSNDAYVLSSTARDSAVTPNALDQIATITGGSVTYTAPGNVNTSSLGGAPTWTYTNDTDHHLTGANKSSFTGTLTYDGLGRLATTSFGGATTIYLYDGVDLVGEYESSGALRARYVRGPSTDEPLIWYDNASGQRHFLFADERGSIIASSDGAGAIGLCCKNRRRVRSAAPEV